MIGNRISTIAGTLAFAAGLIAAAPAPAAIGLGPGGDTLANGAFNQMTFGATGKANVFPLLYVGDFGETGSAKSFLVGTDLSFAYVSPLPGLGTSVVSITYSVTHNGDGLPIPSRTFGSWCRPVRRAHRALSTPRRPSVFLRAETGVVSDFRCRRSRRPADLTDHHRGSAE